MVSLEVIAILLSGISISASLFYYANVLQNQNKTRQTQLFMTLYEVYRSIEFRRQWYSTSSWTWSSHEEFLSKYGAENNVEAFSVLHSVLGFFEGVGMLVKRGDIDIEMVEDLLDIPAVIVWNRFKDFVYGSREKRDWPQLFSNFEYLINQIEERKNQKPTNR